MFNLDAGQLRTPVQVLAVTKVKNERGFTEVTTADALGYPLYTQWKNAHGTEVLQAQEAPQEPPQPPPGPCSQQPTAESSFAFRIEGECLICYN